MRSGLASREGQPGGPEDRSRKSDILGWRGAVARQVESSSIGYANRGFHLVCWPKWRNQIVARGERRMDGEGSTRYVLPLRLQI